MNTLVYTIITAFCIVVLASCMVLVEEKWHKCPEGTHPTNQVMVHEGEIYSICERD